MLGRLLRRTLAAASRPATLARVTARLIVRAGARFVRNNAFSFLIALVLVGAAYALSSSPKGDHTTRATARGPASTPSNVLSPGPGPSRGDAGVQQAAAPNRLKGGGTTLEAPGTSTAVRHPPLVVGRRGAGHRLGHGAGGRRAFRGPRDRSQSATTTASTPSNSTTSSPSSSSPGNSTSKTPTATTRPAPATQMSVRSTTRPRAPVTTASTTSATRVGRTSSAPGTTRTKRPTTRPATSRTTPVAHRTVTTTKGLTTTTINAVTTTRKVRKTPAVRRVRKDQATTATTSGTTTPPATAATTRPPTTTRPAATTTTTGPAATTTTTATTTTSPRGRDRHRG